MKGFTFEKNDHHNTVIVKYGLEVAVVLFVSDENTIVMDIQTETEVGKLEMAKHLSEIYLKAVEMLDPYVER